MPVIIQSNSQYASNSAGNGRGNVVAHVWQSILQVATNFAIL